MKNPMYTIRDRKSGIYGTPFVAPNDACAEREFKAFCNLPNNIYIAEDCELYKVGSVDNETGEVHGSKLPLFMMSFSKEVV